MSASTLVSAAAQGGSPGAGITGTHEPPDVGSGNLNSDPLEEQEAFLPIGPSL